MDGFKVENGVPIPENQTPRSMLRKLEVGQSILVPLEKRASVQSMASAIKRDHGWEYTIKKVDDQQVRVWRTK